MIRVLFVDDEPELLAGLQNALRRHRKEWDMRFVVGGRAALEHLAHEPCDVVVSDLRMPDLNGQELLRRVSEDHPETLRLILSGNAERRQAVELARHAHQYLPKPSEPEVLHAAITRAIALRDSLAQPDLLRLVSGIGDLPSAPGTYCRVREILDDPTGSLKDVADVVAQDPAMAAKVMHLARSAFVGSRFDAADLVQAVLHVGGLLVQGIALSAELASVFVSTHPAHELGLRDVQLQAAATGGLARAIVRGRGQAGADEAFLAGVLHEVGAVILSSRAAEVRLSTVAESRATNTRIDLVERHEMGTTHADLGAYLLTLWGLPQLSVEAVLRHHTPTDPGAPGGEVVLAVHLAAGLVAEALHQPAGEVGHFDPDFLEAAGAVDDLPDLRQLCSREMAHAIGAPR